MDFEFLCLFLLFVIERVCAYNEHVQNDTKNKCKCKFPVKYGNHD